MNKSIKIILAYSIIACTLLYITENIYTPHYLVIMTQKILSFIVIPIILWYYLKHSFWKFWKINKSSFLYWIWFWIFWATVIAIAYYFLRDLIDWQAINESLNNRWVTKATFIFIFIYIMFWNSLLEEYFFRWVIFHSLLEHSKKLAYFASSILFALYHMAIFATWFSWWIMWLAIFWLFLWAMFFAWLYQKTKWIWAAWIFHIIADAIILVIGYVELFN
jgi:uncharacterized protein